MFLSKCFNASGHPRQSHAEAFVIAAGKGDQAAVEQLLSRFSTRIINKKSADGNSGLMYAAIGGRDGMIARLLEKGADIDAKNNEGKTALMLAAEKNRASTVILLLEKGANLEEKTNWGSTALLYAAGDGRYDMAALLLKCGADVDAKNHEGNTAFLAAALNHHDAVADMICQQAAASKTARQVRIRRQEEASLNEDVAAVYKGITKAITIKPIRFRKKPRLPLKLFDIRL
jgi:ankyrin repeat protein